MESEWVWQRLLYTLCLCVAGYSAVAFDSAGNYGHTPTHHGSQFPNHSFKHEDALAQQSTMGKKTGRVLCPCGCHHCVVRSELVNKRLNI